MRGVRGEGRLRRGQDQAGPAAGRLQDAAASAPAAAAAAATAPGGGTAVRPVAGIALRL